METTPGCSSFGPEDTIASIASRVMDILEKEIVNIPDKIVTTSIKKTLWELPTGSGTFSRDLWARKTMLLAECDKILEL